MEKYCTARQAKDDNVIRHMCFVCWITTATDIHLEYNTYCFSTLNGYAYAPHCYITHKLPVLFTIFYCPKMPTVLRALSFLGFNTAGNTAY